MNKKDLISVIVPVYNVQEYLKICLDSILKQTYKDLEIILVDDGSTDSSGTICDEYKKKDNRIKVIHQKNGGLSSARNTGIKIATGKYIAFIDSDDYIEKDMYKRAIETMKQEHAQIFICGRYYLYKDVKEIKQKENIYIIMNNIQALDKMNMFEYYDVAAWDKVYERNLFDGIEFPEGKLCEDWYTIYKVLDKADKIVYDSTPLYVYRQRPNSITHSDNKKINYNSIYASKEVLKFIESKYPSITLNALTKYVFANIGVYNNLLLYVKNSKKQRKEILEVIKKNYNIVIKNTDLIINRKIQLILIQRMNKIYNFMFKLFNLYRNRKIK